MSSNDSNWWASSVQDDFTPVPPRNPYHPQGGRTYGGRYGGGRTPAGGRGGRGDWTPSFNIQHMETSQETERFRDEAREIVEEIVNSDPNKMVSDADFGNIICPRQNFMAVLYVAAQRGHKKYKSSKANLAVRWQFESTSRLLELINDPDKMDKEVNILNGSIGCPPPVTERSRLNDFPGVIGDDIAYGIVHDFFVSIQGSKIGVINDFYTQPNKFINAAYFSKSKPAWNPVQIPPEELQRKPNKQNDAEKNESILLNANNQVGTSSNNTPSKQIKVDSAKAIHKPNTVINLDTSKLLLMPNDVAVKHLLGQLKPYLDEHYGHHDKIFKLLEGKEKEEIARLILSEGDLERLASDNRIYPTSRAQTPSDHDKLKTNPVAYSYVIQYAKENAAGKAANDLLMELYRMLHPIINSFHCHLGLEPMHNASEETTILEPDVMYGILDDTFTSNITKEKYKDTLQFRFRIVTEADIINLLGHVKDFTVDGSKPLSTWLKE
eukprot:scaffold23702_cov53-Cyclotella_meneghiniana.AAC.3